MTENDLSHFSIYFDQDDREGIARWSREQPEGRWQIMIGVNKVPGTLESDMGVGTRDVMHQTSRAEVEMRGYLSGQTMLLTLWPDDATNAVAGVVHGVLRG